MEELDTLLFLILLKRCAITNTLQVLAPVSKDMYLLCRRTISKQNLEESDKLENFVLNL